MVGMDNLDLARRYNLGEITLRQYLQALSRRQPRIRPPYELTKREPHE